MAGYSEYRNEQFIKQYEHITKLKLLTNEELSQVKKKRNFFEISIRSANEVKPFIDYIKYEITLMRKFKQVDYENENDGRALDKVMAYHVKDLFRMALKKFGEKRKIWEHYLEFVKQKFSNSVTGIYKEMLHYHHEIEDFIEAAAHEMTKGNFTIASSILMQGMGVHRNSSKPLVVMYIECSIKQGEDHDGEARKATLQQAQKFYETFLKKDCESSCCELLKKIERYNYSMNLQNYILSDLLTASSGNAEVWELLASRHLNGLVYKSTKSSEAEVSSEEVPAVPFDVKLRYGLAIYEKSLDAVSEDSKKKMFEFYINKLLQLDERKDINGSCLSSVRKSLGKTLFRGFEENSLSEKHFILLLQLQMLDTENNETAIEEMLEKGVDLYSSSMILYELAIKFYLAINAFDKISQIFKIAVINNPKSSIELYRFLCGMYLKNSAEKEKAKSVMLEAINSTNKQVSDAFQPYYLEYVALTETIEKAREAYNLLSTTRTMNSLSLDFFKMMIKLEAADEKPNDKTIVNCYERATEHFGSLNSEIWLEFIHHLWKKGKYAEADEVKKRAVNKMKDNLQTFQDFEMKFTMMRNDVGMEVESF